MPTIAKSELDLKFNRIQNDIYEIKGTYDKIKNDLSEYFNINNKSLAIFPIYKSYQKEINYQLDEIENLNKQIDHLKLDYNENEEKDSSKIEILDQNILGLTELTFDYNKILDLMVEVNEMLDDKQTNNEYDNNKNDNQDNDGGGGGGGKKPNNKMDLTKVEMADLFRSKSNVQKGINASHKSVQDLLSNMHIGGLTLSSYNMKKNGGDFDFSISDLLGVIGGVQDEIEATKNRINTVKRTIDSLKKSITALKAVPKYIGTGTYDERGNEIMKFNPEYPKAQALIKIQEASLKNFEDELKIYIGENGTLAKLQKDYRALTNYYNSLNKASNNMMELYAANEIFNKFNKDGEITISGRNLNSVEAKEFADKMKTMISDSSKYSFDGKIRPNNIKNGLYLSDYNSLLAGLGSMSDFLRFKGTSELYNGIGNFSPKEEDTIHKWEKSILDKGEDSKNDKANLSDNDFFYYDLVAGHKVGQMDATNDIQLDDFISEAYGTINKYASTSDNYNVILTDAKWAVYQDDSWKNQAEILDGMIRKCEEQELVGDNLKEFADFMIKKSEITDKSLELEATYQGDMARRGKEAGEKGNAEEAGEYFLYANDFGTRYLETVENIDIERLSFEEAYKNVDRTKENVLDILDQVYAPITNDTFGEKIITEMNNIGLSLKDTIPAASAIYQVWGGLFNELQEEKTSITESELTTSGLAEDTIGPEITTIEKPDEFVSPEIEKASSGKLNLEGFTDKIELFKLPPDLDYINESLPEGYKATKNKDNLIEIRNEKNNQLIAVLRKSVPVLDPDGDTIGRQYTITYYSEFSVGGENKSNVEGKNRSYATVHTGIYSHDDVEIKICPMNSEGGRTIEQAIKILANHGIRTVAATNFGIDQSFNLTNGELYIMGNPSNSKKGWITGTTADGKMVNAPNSIAFNEDGTMKTPEEIERILTEKYNMQNAATTYTPLIMDGKAVTDNANFVGNAEQRHSRNMTGITAEDDVVIIQVDGATKQKGFVLYNKDSNGNFRSDAYDFVKKVFEPMTGTTIDFLNNDDGGGSVGYIANINGDGNYTELDGIDAYSPSKGYDTMQHNNKVEYEIPGTDGETITFNYRTSKSGKNYDERLTWSQLLIVLK